LNTASHKLIMAKLSKKFPDPTFVITEKFVGSFVNLKKINRMHKEFYACYLADEK
jgi:hypothetical protein